MKTHIFVIKPICISVTIAIVLLVGFMWGSVFAQELEEEQEAIATEEAETTSEAEQVDEAVEVEKEYEEQDMEESSSEEYFEEAELLDEEQEVVVEGEIVAVTDDEMLVVVETEEGDLIEVPLDSEQVTVQSSSGGRRGGSSKKTSAPQVGEKVVVATGELQPEKIVRGIILMYDDEVIAVKRNDTGEIETYRISTSLKNQIAQKKNLSVTTTLQQSKEDEEIILYISNDEEVVYVGDTEDIGEAQEDASRNFTWPIVIIIAVLLLILILATKNRSPVDAQ